MSTKLLEACRGFK